METCDPSKFLVEVVVSDVSKASLVNRRQLHEINWGPWCDCIVGVRTSLLPQLMIFWKLDHEVLGWNWGTLVTLVPESRGASKASKLLSSKQQVSLIREKGCPVFKQPVICLTNLLAVSHESKNRDSRWCRPAHPRCCGETSVLEEQVDCIGDMDQVVEHTTLSMHAVQACNWPGRSVSTSLFLYPQLCSSLLFRQSTSALGKVSQAKSMLAYHW